MSQEAWTAVDDYIGDRLIGHDSILADVLSESARAGLPSHHVSPAQGKLLHLLARIHNARQILEIGTLAGYSTIWFARALPDGGKIVTLELNPRHAEVAQRNFKRAELTNVELHLGPARETLRHFIAASIEPFDLVFIDADKESLCDYFKCALKLSRPGAIIIADNVVRDGQLADPKSDDPRVRGVRDFHELLSKTTCVSATTIQTVGCKGYDGFTLAIVDKPAM
jgi:predicted O-methyltransferase YrrM